MTLSVPKKLRKAIVIGGDSYNTLGIVRSLGEHSIPVYLIIISDRESYVAKSKYVVKSWVIRSASEDLLHILVNNFCDEDEEPVLFPGTDEVVGIIDNNLDLLKEKYILPSINGEQGSISRLMNKKTMNDLSYNFGFLVPKSWQVNLSSTLDIPEKLDFPCIVKPVLSAEGVKTDIVICDNQEMLKKSLLKLQEHYDRVLIQEYISDTKNSIKIGVVGCVSTGGNVLCPAVITKIREYPQNTGTLTYAQVRRNMEALDMDKIVEYFTYIGYQGIFDIEFKYSNNKVYFIETNFRHGSPGYALTKGGVNIPLFWYMSACGEKVNHLNKVVKKDYRLMVETWDIKHVLAGNLGLSRWLRDFFRTKALLFLDFKDLKPVIARIYLEITNKN